jgi:excisionase family DNA binding protein
MTRPPTERDYTVEELSSRLGVSRLTALRGVAMLFEADLKHKPYRIGRCWRIPRALVDEITTGVVVWPSWRKRDDDTA